MEQLRAIPLTVEPEIVVVDTPGLSSRQLQLITDARQSLLSTPGGFDGPQLMAARLAGHRIEAWDMSYSAYIAHRREKFNLLGLGSVGVGVMIFDENGRQLWHRRPQTMVTDPGVWCYGAAGGIRAGMSARQAALEESSEELGLTERDFVSLEPIALAFGGQAGAYPAYRGVIRSDVVLRPDPAEIAETVWVDHPLQQLAPLMPNAEEIYRLLLEQGLVVENDSEGDQVSLPSNKWDAPPVNQITLSPSATPLTAQA